MSYQDHVDMYELAKELIDEEGREVVLRTKISSGVEYDPNFTYEDNKISVVQTKLEKSEIDGTLITLNDIAYLSYDEVKNDQVIVDDSIEHEVILVKPVNPGDVKIIFKTWARA